MSYQEESKRSPLPWIFGCVGGGCLFVMIGLVVAGVIGYNFITGMVSDEPSIVLAPPAPEKLEEVGTKLAEYTKRIDEAEPGEKIEALVLTADEINTMVGDFSQGNEQAPRVKMQIDGDQMSGDVSIPLNDKWVNGYAKFKVTISDGQVDLRVSEFSVNGRELPASVMKGIQQENLAENMNADPEMKDNLKRVKKIEVRDSKVHIELLPEKAEAPEPE